MRDDPKVRELYLSITLLAIAVVAALAPDAYLPMLLRAFLLPGAIGLVIVALLAAWRRWWWVAGGGLAGATLVGLQVATPHLSTTFDAGGTSLRVFHMNVLQPNGAFDQAIAQALGSDADVISIQEVGPRWAKALTDGLRARYPYAHIETRSDCYGIALFSRVPFTTVRTLTIHGAPFIEARLNVEGRPVRLLAVHTSSPISYDHFRRRNEQLAALAEHLTGDDTATIVVGDLNTVPWDQAYQRFCARSGLRSTTPATQRTWPSVGPLALIPLDHVLLSHGLSHTALRTVDIPGSDHRGVLADLILNDHAR